MSTVLHIADYNAPYSGNFIAEIRAFARSSRGLGLQTGIAVPSTATGREWIKLLHSDNIPVHLIPESQHLTAATRAISSIVRRDDVVILHNHFNRRYEIASAMARALNPRRKIGLVWHRRSDGPFHPKFLTPVKNFMGNRLLAPDVRVIALSDELRNQAIVTGIRPEKAKTMFNGIDIDRATSPSRSREEVRRTWGASANTRVVLHFGWEPTIKGVDLLLRAAQLVS